MLTSAELINGLCITLLTLVFWLLKMIFQRHDKIEENLKALTLKVAEEYVPRIENTRILEQIKNDFQQATAQIRSDVKDGFDRIERRMSGEGRANDH